MTLNTNTRLAIGEVSICVLDLMLGVHRVSRKLKNSLLSEQRQRKSALTQMQAQIDRLLGEGNIPNPVWEVLSETQSPFSVSISTTIPRRNFKMPTIPLYDWKMVLVAHVQTYKTWMTITKADTATLCNTFPPTLSGPSQAWFGRLHSGTISNFEKIKE